MSANLAYYPLPERVVRLLEAAERQAALMRFHGREAPEDITIPADAYASIERITRQLSVGRQPPASVSWNGRPVRSAA